MSSESKTNDPGVASHDLFGMLARFYRAVGGWKTYVVRGWYLDANGCPKTHGDGYEESFTDETEYLPNARGMARELAAQDSDNTTDING